MLSFKFSGVTLTTGMDRNGYKWTGMEQEWTEMEHRLLKINNNFNHDTLKCNLFVKKCPKYLGYHKRGPMWLGTVLLLSYLAKIISEFSYLLTQLTYSSAIPE